MLLEQVLGRIYNFVFINDLNRRI